MKAEKRDRRRIDQDASRVNVFGVFSLTRQLMHLGFSPIVTVRHTSPDREGQIYIPVVNALLFAVPVAAAFLFIDLSFVITNATKFSAGGWLPLAIASAVLMLFATWRRGRARLLAVRARLSEPIEAMIDRVTTEDVCRTPGTGIFLSTDEDVAPAILRHYVERVRSLHEQVILITVKAAASPRVPREERLDVTKFPAGFVGSGLFRPAERGGVGPRPAGGTVMT